MTRDEPRAAPVGPNRIVSAHASHVGHVRSSNEDVVIDDPGLALYGVFDGMGGLNAGEVAAQIAAATVSGFVRRHQARQDGRRAAKLADDLALICAAIVHAGRVVRAAGAKDPAWQGMGTTAVVCSLRDPRSAHVAHVGDSRAYLVRGDALYVLTRDHAIGRGVLLRSLGPCAEVRPDSLTVDLAAKDRLLLCSDGLTNYAEEAAIAQVLAAHPDPARAAQALVELALEGGGGDNVSLVVIARTHA